jgi:hypothetical protein
MFLASLAALLLIYARLELQASPPDWSNLIGGLIHGSNSIHSVKGAQLLAGARSSLFALRDRMHTTWLFLAVFATVWFGCLLWMQIERHRRRIDFTRREAFWIEGFTVLMFAMAVLYGLGTNGILARRLPGIIPAYSSAFRTLRTATQSVTKEERPVCIASNTYFRYTSTTLVTFRSPGLAASMSRCKSLAISFLSGEVSWNELREVFRHWRVATHFLQPSPVHS